MFAAAPCRSMHRRRTGFTLLDTVITLAIIGTMAGIAVPRYGQSVARYRADMAARRIVNDLDLLRIRARAQGTFESAYFYTAQDYCKYVSDPDLDDISREYNVYLYEKPYLADIVESSFDGGGRTYMRYGNYGHSYWGGYVLIRVGNETRRIVVDPDTGEATIE